MAPNAVVVGLLTVMSRDLLVELKQLSPTHELLHFSPCEMNQNDWEQKTNIFFQRFVPTKGTWRQVDRNNVYLAWFNFKTELEVAVAIAKASAHGSTHKNYSQPRRLP